MNRKDLENRGLTKYTINKLREIQKEMPSINELIYNTSGNEINQYDLGYMNEAELIKQFEEQDLITDINKFIMERIRNVRMEEQTVEMTGHTLKFFNELQDYELALPNYTREQILEMTKQERLNALRTAYKEEYGIYPEGSDEAHIIGSLTS